MNTIDEYKEGNCKTADCLITLKEGKESTPEVQWGRRPFSTMIIIMYYKVI